MVRGNWQKRVETAEARRNQAKLKKQKGEEKRLFKAMVQDLFALLDQNGSDILRRRNATALDWLIHIWTDTMPSNSVPWEDLVVEEASNQGGKRRPRAVSLGGDEHPVQKAGKKGRARSGSMQDSGKKKVHPRSKEASNLEAASMDDKTGGADSTSTPQMCRSHFFFGKCSDHQGGSGGVVGGGSSGKKSTTCRCLHYTKRAMTLAAVLNDQDTAKRNKPELTKSLDAATTNNNTDFDFGGMEMLYSLSLSLSDCSVTNEETSQSVSEAIGNIMSTQQCSIASIVYCTVNGVLVYDRNRDGLLMNAVDFPKLVLGSTNITEESGVDNKMIEIAGNLPSHILEHILSFLPHSAAARAPQVSTAWNREMKHVSPNFWRQLLMRRAWPIPPNDPSVETLREHFIKHYVVVRDVKALQTGLNSLVNKKPLEEEREMAIQTFSTRRGAPQHPNYCVSVQVWSNDRTLVAYAADCTLRLFQAVPKGNDEKFCREVVCVGVDPYKKTKRKSCRLVTAGLDEDVIGCLLYVMEDSMDSESFVLVVLTRDNFLSATDGSGVSELEEGALQVIDIGEAVLNFLLSCDRADHRLLELQDFLIDGGDTSEVEVLASQSMAACGHGRFMVEVAISIPTLDVEDDEDIVETVRLIDRRLVLFSSSVGAIVWMGDSNPPTQPLRPRNEDMTLESFRRPHPGVSFTSCCVAVVSSSSPTIVTTEIDPSGEVEPTRFNHASQMARVDMMDEGWEVRPVIHRPAVVTATDIVVADNLTRTLPPLDGNADENMVPEHRSVISFFPRHADGYSTLVIGGNCETLRINSFRDDHVLVLVKFLTIEGGGGQWAPNIHGTSLHAIVVHVPSRQEINRTCLLESVEPSQPPLCLAVTGDTVVGGVWWRGIVLTGNNVRSIGEKDTIILEESPQKSAKKKSKASKRRSKGGKKDGFARGLSLRG